MDVKIILKEIKLKLNNNPDLLIREIIVSEKKISLIFLKSTIDKMLLVQSIISPLIDYHGEVTIDNLKNKVLKVIEIEKVSPREYVKNILKNKVILFVEGESEALCIDVEYLPTRQPSEPPTSPTIRGPREGFTESVKTTIALIRKQLPSEQLTIKNYFVGELTHTQITMFYMNNLVDKKLVKKIEKK